MKKLIKILAVLVVLVVIVLVVAFMYLGSIIKKGVETVGPQITKTDVKLGACTVSPFSGTGNLRDFVLGNPEGFKSPTAFKVGEIHVAVDVGSITKDVIVVKEVRIVGPVITYEGGITGNNNFSKIMANVEAATGGGASQPAAGSSGSQKKIQINDLTIKGGKVNIVVTGLGGQALYAVLPDIHMQGIGSGDGITMPEMTQKIMSEITKSVTQVAVNAISSGKLGESASKEAAGAVDKAAKGIKGIFGK